jgi:hypothetical protein
MSPVLPEMHLQEVTSERLECRRRGEELHRLVCASAPSARDTAAKLVLDYVVPRLERRFRTVDDQLIQEAAEDVLMAYLERPGKYDISRGMNLFELLGFYARRRVLDRIRNEARRHSMEVRVSHLILSPPQPLLEKLRVFRIVRSVLASIPSPGDRQLALLRLKGERRTERLALAIKATTLDGADRQRAVKRAKDRVDKYLAAWRQTHNLGAPPESS